MLSVQPGLRDSNDLRVGRKMATSQLFFLSGRAKYLSAPQYIIICITATELFVFTHMHFNRYFSLIYK